MISKPIGVCLFSGLMVSVASMAACGSTTVAGTGGSGTTATTTHATGTGGTTTATTTTSTTSTSTTSTSTTSTSSGAGGSTGSITCGTATCTSTNVDGFVTLEPCCGADPNSCGYNLAPLASLAMLPFPAGCTELMRPGVATTACPSQTFTVEGQTETLPGCCSPTGFCGAVADFSTLDPALNFGCADTSGVGDAGPPQACVLPSDAGTDAADDGGSDDGGADAGADASADAG